MRELAAILVALVLMGLFHWLVQRGSRKAGRAIGRAIGSVLRAPLRFVLTKYYRRKVIRQQQEQRRKEGLPPFENPNLF